MRCFLLTGLLMAATSAVSFAAVDEGLMAFVPPGARLITSVDVNQAKNSQFGLYVMNRINVDDSSFRTLITETGFDPRRDLQDFVFASTGGNGDDARGVLIARGLFDRSRIRASAKANGSTVENYHGTDVYVGGKGHSDGAFAFAAGDIIALGDVDTVHEVLAHAGTAAPLDPRLQQLVTSAGTNNDAWFASLMPGSYLANHVKQETTQAPIQALSSVTQASGGLQFGDSVRLSFDALTKTAKDAQSIADVARFLGSLAQMSRQNGSGGEALASAVDQMKLSVDGDAVHISLLLPEKMLEQMADDNGASAHHHSGLQRR